MATVDSTRPPNIHAGLLRSGLLHRAGRAASGSSAPRPAPAPHPVGAKPPSVVNLSLYRDGRRLVSSSTLPQLFDARRSTRGDGLDRAVPPRPARSSTRSPSEFDLHELAVEDAILAHQRPKLERYGDTLFVVLRAARYVDDVEEVEFGELHVFVGPDFVDHGPPQRGARPGRGARAAGGATPDLLRARPGGGAATRSSTASSTTTRRWSRGSRTTSTRSRPRSSAATRRSPGASTSSPAR